MFQSATLLILGGGTMQLPLIHAARALNCRLLVSDADFEAPGRFLADHFFNIDLKDHSRIYHAARRFAYYHSIDGVVTAGTDFSYAVAYIASKLSLPNAMPMVAARNATHKYHMRRALQRAGISVPLFCSARSTRVKMLNSMRYPLVVKPVDNMGSRGVQKVYSFAELSHAIEKAVEFSVTHTAIVEEFIEGNEYSLDALIQANTFVPCGIARRHIRFPPYFVEIGHTIPAKLPAGHQRELWNTLRRSAHALGIGNGAAKGDLFLSGNKVIVGEVAARLSGGYMSGWTYPLSSGINPSLGAVQIALNRPLSLPPSGHTRYVAERAVISIPGRVAAIEGESQIAQQHAVAHYFIRVHQGAEVYFPHNNVEKCANIIIAAEQKEDIPPLMQHALATLAIRLQPDYESTYNFLFGPQGDHYPNAYNIDNTTFANYLHSYSAIPFDTFIPSSTMLVLPDSFRAVHALQDWHDMPLFTCIQRLSAEYGFQYTWSSLRNTQYFYLPPAFWRAILKGGLQGGRFFFDTLICTSVTFATRFFSWSGF